MKPSIQTIRNLKGQRKIVMITAYDALFASLLDDAADILLVGDSLEMSFAGRQDTLGATMESMIYHTQAVCRGAKKAVVVCDMPFGSTTTSDEALANAVRVYRETSAHAIKIEGGEEKASLIRHLTEHGIAIMGHVGLLPQFVRAEGGYRIKGHDELSAQKIIRDAQAIEAAGVFAIVIEGVKSEIATKVAQTVSVPVIGIGAGAGVDGQVLVFSDMLGFFEAFKPKFVRRYLEGGALVREAAKRFAEDVRSGAFPAREEEY
ncbi:MAG: 3-methyl-2-oxobutanoate hydroxymethyltransferase [Campylobacterales bacterium]